MATLQTLVDEHVLPLVAAASEAAAIWAFRRASREFFNATHAYQKELTPVSIAASVQTALSPGADLEVYDAVQCWYGEERLEKATSAKAKRVLGVGSTSASPSYFWIEGVNSLVLSPAAAAGKTLTLLARVRPTLTAAALDDAMVAKYGDILGGGALAYLLRMPSQPWTNYEAAQEADDIFQLAIDKHSALAVDGGVGTPRRVKYGGL